MIKGHLSRDFSFPLLVSQYLQGLIILQAEVSCFSPPLLVCTMMVCYTHQVDVLQSGEEGAPGTNSPVSSSSSVSCTHWSTQAHLLDHCCYYYCRHCCCWSDPMFQFAFLLSAVMIAVTSTLNVSLCQMLNPMKWPYLQVGLSPWAAMKLSIWNHWINQPEIR